MKANESRFVFQGSITPEIAQSLYETAQELGLRATELVVSRAEDAPVPETSISRLPSYEVDKTPEVVRANYDNFVDYARETEFNRGTVTTIWDCLVWDAYESDGTEDPSPFKFNTVAWRDEIVFDERRSAKVIKTVPKTTGWGGLNVGAAFEWLQSIAPELESLQQQNSERSRLRVNELTRGIGPRSFKFLSNLIYRLNGMDGPYPVEEFSTSAKRSIEQAQQQIVDELANNERSIDGTHYLVDEFVNEQSVVRAGVSRKNLVKFLEDRKDVFGIRQVSMAMTFFVGSEKCFVYNMGELQYLDLKRVPEEWDKLTTRQRQILSRLIKEVTKKSDEVKSQV